MLDFEANYILTFLRYFLLYGVCHVYLPQKKMKDPHPRPHNVSFVASQFVRPTNVTKMD